MESLLYGFTTAAGIAGFSLAYYIHRHKRHNKTLICPLDSDCDSVIHSKYSRLFGIPVENLGMLYYGLIAISYASFIAIPELNTREMTILVLIVTVIAFLFSLYLTAIQAFVIKEWCTWCLMSTGLCTVIFILALAVSDFTITELLSLT